MGSLRDKVLLQFTVCCNTVAKIITKTIWEVPYYASYSQL